jgi:hypothetical protein
MGMMLDSIERSFKYFYYLDNANAQIHLSEVRYSPITFLLADSLYLMSDRSPEVTAVLAHKNQYPLDRGRIELEDQPGDSDGREPSGDHHTVDRDRLGEQPDDEGDGEQNHRDEEEKIGSSRLPTGDVGEHGEHGATVPHNEIEQT